MKRLTAFLLALCLLRVPIASAAGLEEDVLPTLKALEILVGDGSGNLNLAAPVSRAEFAKLLAASSPYADAIGGEGAGYSLFSDVKSAHWASEYIKLCLDNGWMIGYTDGAFRPGNTVTLEEACTAALRLLGYDSNNLSGSFPAAQLNKAAAVGLRDGVDALRGQALTRSDCAQLFYNLLTCKTSQGQVYANTLGYTLDSDGQVDYLAAVKEELDGPSLWDSGELGFTPAVTYLNDRAVDKLTWQTDDVYYTAGDYLWVYRDTVFGQIGAVTPSAANPTAVSVDGKSYSIGADAVKDQLAALGSKAVGATVTLLLGMDGQVAALRAVGGPYIASGSDVLSFTPQTVYRDGEQSGQSALSAGDVYYADAASRTLWIYTDKVSGKIQALTPSALVPTAVTISGVSYTLGSDDLRRELSALNGKWTDKFVTLLLGMDGSVAGVLTGEAVEATYYGVVQSAANTASGGAVEQQVTLFCTDGRSHTFSDTADADWDSGDLVQATVSGGGVRLTSLSARGLTGTVRGGAKLGSYPLADDLRVIDTTNDGAAVAVEPASLSGLSLSSGDVRYYALNAAGEITDLILNDVTGALWSYGYLADAEMQGSGMNLSGSYTLALDGKTQTYSVNQKSFPVTEGCGVAVRMTGNTISAMRGLKKAALTSVGAATATAGAQTFPLSDQVQVYLDGEDDAVYAVELADVTGGGFTLTGYYDAAQKQIRVILAK